MLLLPCGAKLASFKKELKNSKKIKPSEKRIFLATDLHLHKNRIDLVIDALVEKQLGSAFRRASAYDIYPLEIYPQEAKKLKHKEQVELMDYYNYSRKNLEKISKSPWIKFLKQDFDLDGIEDTAMLVYNIKESKIYFAILNNYKKLYLKESKADFPEKINEGKYPTKIICGKKNKQIEVPAIRLVFFDSEPEILFYNKKTKNFEEFGH